MRKAAILSLALAASLTLLSPFAALAQTNAQKKEATDAFKACREMEQYGEATACWKRWLEKHRANGGEAEVMVAEERAAKGKPPAEKPAKPEEPPPATEPPATEPEATEEPSPSEAPPIDEPEAVAVLVPVSAVGDDLCNKGGTAQKSAVVFAIAGAEALGQDAQLAKAEAPKHLNEVFLQRFPNRRFRNVTTTLSGDNAWATAKSIPLADIKKLIETKSDGEAESFLLKSLSCADYVVFSSLTTFSSKPGDGPGGVSIEMAANMGIFTRGADQATLLASFDATVPSMFDKAEDAAAQTAAGALDGATSSVDSANQQAAQAGQLADQAGDAAKAVGDTASAVAEGEVPEGVSTGAGSECAAGASCEEAAPAEPLIEKPSLDAHERMGSVCMKAAKSKDPTALLSCEIRVRAYMIAKSFSSSSQDVPGWQLSAPLSFDGKNYGLPLGKAENLKVGDGFAVLDENGDRVAYFKVTSVGPGGADGANSPSKLSLRLGQAPEGAVVSEHKMLGLGLQLHGAAAFTLGAQDHIAPLLLDLDDSDTAYGQYFRIPDLMFGGGATLSYDLSWLISLSETSVRLGADYLMGDGRDTLATQIATELIFEKGFYLGKAFELYLGVGPTFSLITLKSVPQYNSLPLVQGQTIPGQIVEMKATRFGGEGLVGLELLFTPNFGIRAEGNFRFNIAKQGYDSPSPATSTCPIEPTDPDSMLITRDSRVCWGYDQRKDSWTAAGARVGAIVMF
jgi:hypothetical protein